MLADTPQELLSPPVTWKCPPSSASHALFTTLASGKLDCYYCLGGLLLSLLREESLPEEEKSPEELEERDDPDEEEEDDDCSLFSGLCLTGTAPFSSLMTNLWALLFISSVTLLTSSFAFSLRFLWCNITFLSSV